MSPLVNDRKPFVAKDRLADYVDVKERIRLFYERYPDGRLVTYEVRSTAEPDDVPRVWVWAKAYRTPDDPLPADGWSWMTLPGATSFTRGSELENTETSAWGRAIGALGLGIKDSIATTDEIASKGGGSESGQPAPPPPEAPEPAPDGQVTLSGTAAGGRQSPVDLMLRQTPDGSVFGFVIVSENTGRTQAIILGQLADDVYDAIAHDGVNLQGKPVTVTGTLERVPWQKTQPDGSVRDMPPYKRLRVSRIATEDWTLPEERVEAESLPLFDGDAA